MREASRCLAGKLDSVLTVSFYHPHRLRRAFRAATLLRFHVRKPAERHRARPRLHDGRQDFAWVAADSETDSRAVHATSMRTRRRRAQISEPPSTSSNDGMRVCQSRAGAASAIVLARVKVIGRGDRIGQSEIKLRHCNPRTTASPRNRGSWANIRSRLSVLPLAVASQPARRPPRGAVEFGQIARTRSVAVRITGWLRGSRR